MSFCGEVGATILAADRVKPLQAGEGGAKKEEEEELPGSIAQFPPALAAEPLSSAPTPAPPAISFLELEGEVAEVVEGRDGAEKRVPRLLAWDGAPTLNPGPENLNSASQKPWMVYGRFHGSGIEREN